MLLDLLSRPNGLLVLLFLLVLLLSPERILDINSEIPEE